MKNLFFSLVATVAISAFAAAQTNFVKMNLPRNLQSISKSYETVTEDVVVTDKQSKKKTTGQIRFTIPDEGSGLVSVEFSKNLVDGKIVTEDFFVQYYSKVAPDSGSGFDLGNCLAECRKTFTDENGKKKPGRGECKTGCWLNWLGINIGENAAPIIIEKIIRSLTK